MLVKNNFNLYQNKFISNQTVNSQPQMTAGDLKYKGEISKVCYKPLFGGKKELSDDEFNIRLSLLSEFINNKYQKASVQDRRKMNKNTAAIITKDNIDIVEKLAKNVSYKKVFLDMISNLNNENRQFVENIILGYALEHNIDTDYYPLEQINKYNADIIENLYYNNFSAEYIEDVIPCIDKETRKLALELCKDGAEGMGYLYDTLKPFEVNKSGICVLSMLCDYSLSKTPRSEFPQKFIPFIPDKLKSEDVGVLKRIYNDKNIDNKDKRELFRNLQESNMQVVKHLMDNPNDIDIIDLKGLQRINEYNCGFVIKVLNDKTISNAEKAACIDATIFSPFMTELIEKLYNNKGFPKEKLKDFLANSYLCSEVKSFIAEADILEAEKKIAHQLKIMKQNPDKYINNADDNIDLRKEYYYQLLVLCDIYDKESIDVLFRKRLANARTYLNKLTEFSYKDLKLLKSVVNLPNASGKPLMPQQKLDIIDIITNYHSNKYSLDGLYKMVAEGKIDISRLQAGMLESTFNKLGYTIDELKEIPDEKLFTWDTNYIHQLESHLTDSYFRDLIIFANSKQDFKDIIQDTSNIYGLANEKTRKQFGEYKMNYETWVNPPKDLKMDFIMQDENAVRLKRIAIKVKDDVERLRKTPAKSFIDKQYPQCIHDDKFEIPKEIVNNKDKLHMFTLGVVNQLCGVWKHAEGSLNNPEKELDARDTLNIRNNFMKRLTEISDIRYSQAVKPLNLTIKLWDRFPQKDLFQGNYSTCCLAMDHTTADSVPIYLMNTAFNMIELIDKNSGDTIGNAVCYFVSDEANRPCFILDDIEIRHNDIPPEDFGRSLRKGIMDFSYELCKRVTGRDDTEIYLGDAFNDVPDDDLIRGQKPVKFIGDYAPDDEKVYLDAYYGLIDRDNLKFDNIKCSRLK